MYERKYVVELDGEILAKDVDIDTATILIKALTEEYHMQMEYGGRITLRAQPRANQLEE